MPQASSMKKTRKLALIGIGDNGSGKTGSLVEVINNAKDLGLERIVISDWDNGIDILLEKCKPEALENVYIETFRDELKAQVDGSKPIVRGSDLPDQSKLKNSMAWARGCQLMNNWKTKDYDLGRPNEWGLETLFVSDTITGMGDATLNFANAVFKETTWKGTGTAMGLQDGYIQLCTGLKCHFILMSHIRYMGGGGKVTIQEAPQKGGETSTKEVDSQVDGTAYPSALGRILPTQIARHFNTLIEYKLKDHGKRVALTRGSERFPLKCPFNVSNELHQETALLKIFKAMQE